MEKNKLDKLFQDKFAEREFEFQNSYWEEAEALIEATERGRQKRIFAWIFGILLLLVFAISGWYLTNIDVPEIAEKGKNEVIENTKTFERNSTISNTEEAENRTKEAKFNRANSALNKDILEKENKVFADEKIASEKTSNSDSNSSGKRNEKIVDIVGKSFSKNEVISSESVDYNGVKSQTFSKENELPFENSLILNNEKASNENDNLPNDEIIEKPVAEADLKEKSKSETASENLANLNFLTANFALLNWKKELNRSLQNVNIDEAKYPLKSHRWQLEANVGLSVIPNPKTNDNSLANIFGGLAFGYKITPNLILQTGLNYQITQLDSMISEGSRQISYAFGKQDDLVYLETSQLHFLEMPVLVGYQVGKMQFSAGFKTGKLLAAKGKTSIAESQFPWERTEEENADFNARLIQARDNGQEKPVFRTEENGESGWLATDNFKAWQFSLVGKYQFQVSPRFDLGIGVEYHLNPHYLKNEIGNNAPLSIQFFTTYKIFN